ncbi:MAG: hypothetical protein Kow0092_10620 [Deferrisomatales bacterium]
MVLGSIAVTAAVTVVTGISPVPTSRRVRRVVLAVLPDELEGEIFELGSGWGSLAFPLARRYPGATVRAYELSPVPWLVSQARHLVSDTPNLSIAWGDFHGASLSEAAAVVCYLYPGGMERLRPKFERELPAGAVVVSHFFPVPGWRPACVRRADDAEGSPVYLYRVSGDDEKKGVIRETTG